MDRKKVMKIFGGFLAVMLIFTILSRAVNGASMARVETVKISFGTIEHKVMASGRVEAGQEIAVCTESGQRVTEICVKEGQSVEKGDVLFRLDMEELEEQILAARQEMERTKLQNQDAQNAKAFEQNNQQTARQRAQEDYNQAVAQGDSDVADAKRAWDAAEQALQDYLNSTADTGNEGTGNPSAGESPQGADRQSAEESPQGADGQSDGENLQGEDGQPAGESPQEEDGKSAGENPQGADSQSDGNSPQGADNSSAGENPDGADNPAADREAEKAALQQAAADAKAAYDAAVSSRADNVRAAARSLEDASKPQSAADSTEKQNEITRQQQELALNKLLRLQTEGGEVKSTISGVVTQILVSTGDFTSEGAAIRMADTSQGGRIVLSVDKFDEDYVSKGCPVKLKVSGSKESISDYTVSNVTDNEQDNMLLDVAIDLPKGVLEAGTLVDVEIVPKSENYNSIVPLEALHEEQNGCYVLVVEEEAGVLGTELVVRRLDVEVLDRNSTDAALEEGLLTTDQEIVRSSSRSIQEGSRVRR